MAAILWSDVTSIAPELNGKVNLIAQDVILQVATTMVAVAQWDGEEGPKTRAGRIYYAAHLATLQLRRGIPGPVSASAAGGMSRAWGMPALGTFSALQLTSYGVLYLELAKTTRARAGVSLGRVPGVPFSIRRGP